MEIPLHLCEVSARNPAGFQSESVGLIVKMSFIIMQYHLALSLRLFQEI